MKLNELMRNLTQCQKLLKYLSNYKPLTTTLKLQASCLLFFEHVSIPKSYELSKINEIMTNVSHDRSSWLGFLTNIVTSSSAFFPHLIARFQLLSQHIFYLNIDKLYLLFVM